MIAHYHSTSMSLLQVKPVTSIYKLYNTSEMFSPITPPIALPAPSSASVSIMPTLYSSVPPSNITKLHRIQNTLVRIVTRQHGWTGTSQSLATLHWLPVKWRVDFKVATISYKLLSTGQPSYLSNSIYMYVPGHSLRSTGVDTLSAPGTKTVIIACAFRSAAPSVWNSLPADIRNSSSYQHCAADSKHTFFGLPLNN